MISFQDLFNDSINGLEIRDLPFITLQMLCAAIAAIILRFVGIKRMKVDRSELAYLPLFAIGICFVTILAANSVTLGLIFIAVSVLFRNKREPNSTRDLLIFLNVVLSLGFGSQHVALTMILAIISGIVLFLNPGK